MGVRAEYRQAAEELGRLLLNRNIRLVYGGANVGLMKVLADTVLDGGGEVIGVMPRILVEKEVAHQGLTKMHIVKSMSERKSLMVELSDAFIAMPGGFGTLDELAEVITYNQLRLTDKPIGILANAGWMTDDVIRKIIEEAHRGSGKVVYDADPQRLVQKVIALIRKEKLIKI